MSLFLAPAAAATLHNPELLLLDEPTSAVDPQSRRDFWESLFDLVNRGTTILVSTHYMDEAERCHGLAILDGGKLVAEGAPRQLMDRIDAIVMEIEADDVRGARHALDGQPFVKSVAQLGNRLHALLATNVSEPESRVRNLLQQQRVQGTVERVRASLETFGMIVGIPLLQMLMFSYAINYDVRGLAAASSCEGRGWASCWCRSAS